jgi:hypothetical protein
MFGVKATRQPQGASYAKLPDWLGILEYRTAIVTSQKSGNRAMERRM